MKDEESNKGGQDGRYAQMMDECEDKIKDRAQQQDGYVNGQTGEIG